MHAFELARLNEGHRQPRSRMVPWTITHDPLTLAFGVHNLYVDLGAERVIAAERAGEQIAVEIKSFVGPSELSILVFNADQEIIQQWLP